MLSLSFSPHVSLRSVFLFVRSCPPLPPLSAFCYLTVLQFVCSLFFSLSFRLFSAILSLFFSLSELFLYFLFQFVLFIFKNWFGGLFASWSVLWLVSHFVTFALFFNASFFQKGLIFPLWFFICVLLFLLSFSFKFRLQTIRPIFTPPKQHT